MSELQQAGTGPCPDEDELVELALGHADRLGADRLSVHLATCAACRRSYDDLAGAVEAVLPAVPRIAPPPGFEEVALQRLEEARQDLAEAYAPGPSDPAGGPGPTRRPAPDPRPGRRAVLVAAAAAVLGAATGAGATAYLTRGEPSPWATPLLTADGRRVGTVSPSYGDAGAFLVVDVTHGPSGRSYTCRLRTADGSSQDVATWSLADDRPNSWVVAVEDPDAVVAVELVGPSGAVWSTAALGAQSA